MLSTQRREAIVVVDDGLLLDILQTGDSGALAVFALLPQAQLPEDSTIVSINYSPLHRGLLVTLRSRAFSPVPIGEQLPMLGPIEIWRRKIKKEWLEEPAE